MERKGVNVEERIGERRIVLDLDLCIGCRSCEAACRVAFKNEGRIRHAEIGSQAYLPLACRHCEDPLCATACPVDAIVQDESTGLTRRLPFLCIGCSSCMYACPFGVLDGSLIRHLSQKCDYCRDREDGPRCVSSCVSGALQYLTQKEYEKRGIATRTLSRHPFWRRS
ncbi:hypothetical protein AMJ40_01390 [candidate division TA06 bacterium DG_26]|uniref:4Fe-4S ferredoxin-type domain-containing protein n=1 Tax=candidate division TA06 bacterium DG_26 TaxID=1703771 RepID=A0A0S7WLC5_UNCT6|nr:MAG: hypothetical protein AMJ40_01390 [candidate division TA06 bacterium DG_26]